MSNSFEKPPTSPLPESSAEKEKEPILRVLISRHGPKLSAAGEKNQLAAYFEDHVRAGYRRMDVVENETGLARLASSPVRRALDTVEIYGDELDQTQHRSKEWISFKGELATPYQPAEEGLDEKFSDDFETIVVMQSELEPIIRNEVEVNLASLGEEAREAEVRNQIDTAVMSRMFEDASNPEAERTFKVSYEELADDFARRYAGFARHTKLLEKLRAEGSSQPQEEPYVQIDVTHSFPTTAFLKKYLVFADGTRARDIPPTEFFERTGGIIHESGSFEMKYIGGEKGASEISVRGEFKEGKQFEGTVDLEELRKLNPKK